jgi:hypothetical protein
MGVQLAFGSAAGGKLENACQVALAELDCGGIARMYLAS